jgi:hypothetical protein
MALILRFPSRGKDAMARLRHPMSTPDWMRSSGELERPQRQGMPLGGMVAWALGLVVAANLALVLIRLMG